MLANHQGQTPSAPWPVAAGASPEPTPDSWQDRPHADFLNLDGLVSDPVINEGETVIWVQAKQIEIPTIPPDCCCPVNKVKAHTPFVMKSIRDLPRGRKGVVIRIKRRRWMCTCCRANTVTQPLGCLAEDHYRMTYRLLKYLEVWSLLVPELSLSHETGVFVRTIREIRKKYVERLKKEVEFETPRVLGLDGVRADSRKRRVILTDPAAGLVLDLLKSGKAESIAAGIRKLPGWEKIEIYTIDMCRTLRAAVLKVQPDAVIIVDLFHIMRVGNQFMDKVRRRLYKADKDAREPGQRRPRPEPFRMRRAKLEELQRKGKGHLIRYVESWFDQQPELHIAYDLKEAFMAIFDAQTYGGRQFMNSAAARRRYEEWKAKLPSKDENRAMWQDLKPIRTAMNNWAEYIFNYFDYGYTNMFTEAMNRKLKDILRDARGCDFETLHARIVCGTYLRRQMSLDRQLEMNALMPRSKSRRGRLSNAKGKDASKEQGEGGGSSQDYELPGHAQMILDFSGPGIPES